MEMENYIASRGKRFLAYLIDVLPISFLVTVIFIVFFDFGDTFNEYLNRGDDIEPRVQFLKERNWIRDISFLIWIIYCIFMEASEKQATFGKQLMKIKVAGEQGERLDLKKSLARNLSKTLSAAVIALGFIWILFDKKRQGWHDKIAKTLVINQEAENIRTKEDEVP